MKYKAGDKIIITETMNPYIQKGDIYFIKELKHLSNFDLYVIEEIKVKLSMDNLYYGHEHYGLPDTFDPLSELYMPNQQLELF